MDVKKELNALKQQWRKAYDLPSFEAFQQENLRLLRKKEHILSHCSHEGNNPNQKDGYVTCIHCDEWFWYCPKAPNNMCSYDSKKDPAHDECLYCGKPEERK